METLFKVEIPISADARWLNDLKRVLAGTNVKWHNPENFHLTLAFMDKTPSITEEEKIIDRHMIDRPAFEIVFDKIDVFTTGSGENHIINLTSTSIPEEFLQWLDGLRNDLKMNGCVMNYGFRLHLTLGEVRTSYASLESIRHRLSGFQIPPFRIPLRSFIYRVFKGRTIRKWN